MRTIICLLILFFSIAAMADTVALGNFNCEHTGDRFDPNLQIEYNLRYQGQASCRTDIGTYYMNFSSPIPLANTTFKITFYQENNGNRFTLRGRLANNTTVNFTRTNSSVSYVGADGRTWFLMTYEYTGSASQAGQMTRIEWLSSGTTRIDGIGGTYDDPLSNSRYLKMKTGYQDILINFNIEDVLNQTILSKTFRLEGKLNTNDQGNIIAFDSTPVNPYVYVECSSVALINVITNPADALGVNYTVECIPPTLINAERGLFRITNHGAKPTFPVEFIVEFKSIPRITENARSASFYFPMSLKTRINP
ncbi:hypothetical protein ACJVC5_08210 [Peredibacter sp. HCB2-198]|uniref:hypothetical protein n=1 Tax=Peredibacter sp. HCB2-198 TaxID=3383025 RepID=UPI0038B43F6D